MAALQDTPSPALLGLRPADVVRLCGLNAAAAGLELADSHCVVNCRRAGSRLQADVSGEQLCSVWVEVPDGPEPPTWRCDCGSAGPLACVHVAAILSAWIAHPTDFVTPQPVSIPGDVSQPTPATRTEPPALDAPDVPAVPAVPARPLPARGPLAPDETTMAAALARMSGPDVSALAHRILGDASPDDPSAARREIARALGDDGRVRVLLGRLDESARRLFTLLDLAGGAITTSDLEGLALRMGWALSAMQSDVAVLERHVLLLPMLPTTAPSEHGPGASWRHVAGWRVPDEIRRALILKLPLHPLAVVRSGHPASPPIDSANPSGVPLRVIRSLPRTLCLALALLAAGPPPLGMARNTGQRDDIALPAERLANQARAAGLDVATVRLTRLLLWQADEKHPGGQSLDMARIPTAERPVMLRTAFRRWLRADSADDLLAMEAATDAVRIRYAAGAGRPETLARETSDARRFVAHLLRSAEPETWYALDDALRLAWQLRPGLLRGQQLTWSRPTWWLESSQQRILQPQQRDDWMLGEGSFIRTLLAGALSVWGAVDLAEREDGSLAAFRLTPFGAYLLQRDDAPAAESLAPLCSGDWGPAVLPLREGALAVQPLAAEPRVLDALALWAVPTAISGKRLLYTLSPDRASTAFDAQHAPDSLPALLQLLHGRAAEAVANRLSAWHAAWGKTRLTTGYTLVEASDEATLVEALANSPEIAARCRRIGPGLALALPEDAVALRLALARRGYVV